MAKSVLAPVPSITPITLHILPMTNHTRRQQTSKRKAFYFVRLNEPEISITVTNRPVHELDYKQSTNDLMSSGRKLQMQHLHSWGKNETY